LHREVPEREAEDTHPDESDCEDDPRHALVAIHEFVPGTGGWVFLVGAKNGR
jgi:hypothetical protein